MKTVGSRRERLLILIAICLPMAWLSLELQREMSFPGFHGNDMNSHVRYIRLFAEAMDRAPEAKGEVFIVNLSGRGDKDTDIYRENIKELDIDSH